jgi:hypothetical protein
VGRGMRGNGGRRSSVHRWDCSRSERMMQHGRAKGEGHDGVACGESAVKASRGSQGRWFPFTPSGDCRGGATW